MWFLFFLSWSIQVVAVNVVRETSTESVWVDILLNNSGDISELIFSDNSRVKYEYVDQRLVKIIRLDSAEKELYTHTYEWKDERLISQTGWYTTQYAYDNLNRIILQISPWYHETIEYDISGQLTLVGDKSYSYNNSGEITAEDGFFQASYDYKHNLIELNTSSIQVDDLNQVVGFSYDVQGNLLKQDFIYDEKNQLIEATGIAYAYDKYGRRISKGTTTYLYLGFEEIGAFENAKCKTLKIPGIGGPISIEIDGKPYAPIIDARGIIKKLIDPAKNSIHMTIDSDVFGEGITDTIPYAYRGKRYDPETGFIYFGLRYYDPKQHRWITRDPLGPIDHSNLYQYVYNNPLLYWDVTGGSFWGYVGGLCEIAAGGAIIASGFGLEVITFGGFTLGLGVTTSTGAALIGHGLAMTTYHGQDMKIPPRFDGQILGTDPSKCPEKGFEWRGKGSPETGRGNWINTETGERLHPDHNHPPGKNPHWGYTNSEGVEYDLYLDGSWQ